MTLPTHPHYEHPVLVA